MSSKRAEEELQHIVGARIRSLRTARGWTQEELGARAEVDFRTIGGVERGERAPSLSSLQRIAEALEVDMAELVRQGVARSGAEGEALLQTLVSTVCDLPVEEVRYVVALAKLYRDHLVKPSNRR